MARRGLSAGEDVIDRLLRNFVALGDLFDGDAGLVDGGGDLPVAGLYVSALLAVCPE
jgi:hypothetical protein